MPSHHCDARVRALCGDALELTPQALRAHTPLGFTTVLSDLCPATSGSGSLDATRSAVLAEAAVELALGEHGVAFAGNSDADDARTQAPPNAGVLLPGGALVVKILEGDGGARQTLQAICKVGFLYAPDAHALALTPPRAQLHFAKVAWVRPKATRSISREVYLVALGRQRARGMKA